MGICDAGLAERTIISKADVLSGRGRFIWACKTSLNLILEKPVFDATSRPISLRPVHGLPHARRMS
jgi:hypothetical protein